MIAPRDQLIRTLTLGLQPQEQAFIEQLVQQNQGVLECAKDDMDLWNLAQSGHFDACILGQSDSVPEPSYLVWLLKGLAKHSHIILLYSVLQEDEAQKIQRLKATHVLTRPLESDRLIKALDSVLNEPNVRQDGILSRLSRLFSFRRREIIPTHDHS